MSVSRVQQLRQENSQLKQRIAQIKVQQSTNNLQDEITRFVQESKNNLNEMNKKIVEQNAKQNSLIHALTSNYEGVLKRQIQLLHENKKLSQKKEEQDKIFNEGVDKLTLEYENQIKSFENKVKANVKRIQDLSNGGNMIARLLANPRFKQVMQQRGCSLEALENQCKLEEVSQEVQERERQIQQAQEKSARLDQELVKMHELIDTMKNLLQNMMKEKENILKQNTVLKQKLKQSEILIAKLLGENLPQEGAEDQNEEEEQEEGDQQQIQQENVQQEEK